MNGWIYCESGFFRFGRENITKDLRRVGECFHSGYAKTFDCRWFEFCFIISFLYVYGALYVSSVQHFKSRIPQGAELIHAILCCTGFCMNFRIVLLGFIANCFVPAKEGYTLLPSCEISNKERTYFVTTELSYIYYSYNRYDCKFHLHCTALVAHVLEI